MFFVLKSTYEAMQRRYDALHNAYADVVERYLNEFSRVSQLEQALRDIIEQNTKGSNATVKRMVKLAEEALNNETGTTSVQDDAKGTSEG